MTAALIGVGVAIGVVAIGFLSYKALQWVHARRVAQGKKTWIKP